MTASCSLGVVVVPCSTTAYTWVASDVPTRHVTLYCHQAGEAEREEIQVSVQILCLYSLRHVNDSF